VPVGASVATRPRGVRCRKPCWIRNGSITSSIVSRSSPIAGGHVVEADRPAVEAVDHRLEELSVHHVEAVRVDVEHRQRQVGERPGDLALALDVGIVAHPPEQPVGHPRRAARAPGDFEAALVVELDLEQAGRAADDLRQLLGRCRTRAGRRCRSGRAAGWLACRRGWSRRSG
jgi:hypothetical protein